MLQLNPIHYSEAVHFMDSKFYGQLQLHSKLFLKLLLNWTKVPVMFIQLPPEQLQRSALLILSHPKP